MSRRDLGTALPDRGAMRWWRVVACTTMVAATLAVLAWMSRLAAVMVLAMALLMIAVLVLVAGGVLGFGLMRFRSRAARQLTRQLAALRAALFRPDADAGRLLELFAEMSASIGAHPRDSGAGWLYIHAMDLLSTWAARAGDPEVLASIGSAARDVITTGCVPAPSGTMMVDIVRRCAIGLRAHESSFTDHALELLEHVLVLAPYVDQVYAGGARSDIEEADWQRPGLVRQAMEARAPGGSPAAQSSAWVLYERLRARALTGPGPEWAYHEYALAAGYLAEQALRDGDGETLQALLSDFRALLERYKAAADGPPSMAGNSDRIILDIIEAVANRAPEPVVAEAAATLLGELTMMFHAELHRYWRVRHGRDGEGTGH